MNFTTTNPVKGATLKEKEEYILKHLKPLALVGYSLTEDDENLEDFIHNFLAVYNRMHKTAFLSDLDSAQCLAGRHRSLVDIFLICKHYFPDCTLKEVRDSLYSLGDNLCYQLCSTVHRRVYELKIKYPSMNRHGQTSKDEFGCTEAELLSLN